MTGPEIAESLEIALSTVSVVLQRIGLGKLSRLVLPKPIHLYKLTHPIELIHIYFNNLLLIYTLRLSSAERQAHLADQRPFCYFVHVCVYYATLLSFF